LILDQLVRAPNVALDQVDGLAHVLDGGARLRVARERREKGRIETPLDYAGRDVDGAERRVDLVGHAGDHLRERAVSRQFHLGANRLLLHRFAEYAFAGCAHRLAQIRQRRGQELRRLGQERQERVPLENEELAWREAHNAGRTRPAVDQREFAEILARRAGEKIDLVAVVALLVDPDFPGKDDVEAIGSISLAEDGLAGRHCLGAAGGGNRPQVIRRKGGEQGDRRQEGFRGHGHGSLPG
jgi:hypothetical protein